MVTGEAIYKAAARIEKYGVKAFVDMLGKKAIKKRGGRARLLKYYTEKYPTAPLRLEPKAPVITRSMRSYWKDVKALAKARNIGTKASRKILKGLKTDSKVQVRVVKDGHGWQFILFGKFEHWDKEEMENEEKDPEKKHEIKDETGWSYVHYCDEYYEEEEEAFDEAKRDAQYTLGGSGWQLIKVLKETWIRFYGREK